LIFDTQDRPKKNFDVKDYEPPKEMVEKINKWLNDYPIITDTYGEIQPKEISLTPEAWDKYMEYQAMAEKKVATIPYPFNELYVRAQEQVAKLATVFADDDFVGLPEIQAAISIVNESIENLNKFASGISDNLHEQNVNMVIDVIKRAGDEGISKNQLTQKTRKLNNRDRNEIINQILESGEVVDHKDGKKVTLKFVF